jgi:hypothetical protein
MRGRKKELFDRQFQIEQVAGVSLMKYSGEIDWDHFHRSQNDLEAVNPEYKTIRAELSAIRDKESARRDAHRKRTNELRYCLQSIVQVNGLNDEQQVALRTAIELIYSCKDGVVVRAEKRAKKQAAETVPAFRPASWQSKRKPKAVGA